MTDKELWDAAWAELKLTTDSYPTWKKKGFPSSSHWANAKALGDQIGAVTPPTGSLLWQETFETIYAGGPSGLDPNKFPLSSDDPAVTGQVPANTVLNRQSWGNSAPPDLIAIGSPPTQGEGAKAINVNMAAATNSSWFTYWRRAAQYDAYYGFMYYLPSSWVAPTTDAGGSYGHNPCTVAEFNYRPYVYGGGAAGFGMHQDSLKLYVNSGYAEGNGVSSHGGVQFSDYGNGGSWETLPASGNTLGNWTADGWYPIPLGQMNKGVWHQVILRIRWTLGPANGGLDAIWQAWWKRKGETNWNLTVDKTGPYPSLLWGLDVNGYTWTPQQALGATVHQNFGFLRPTGIQNNYWMDNLSEGTSFAAVAATMP